MQQTWCIVLADGEQRFIKCDIVGVANNGELLCFNATPQMQQPMAIQGWAQGEWKSFAKSNVAIQ